MIEAVNPPAHYGGADDPYEVIKVLRAWLTSDEYAGFLKGNVIKYEARARRKGGWRTIGRLSGTRTSSCDS